MRGEGEISVFIKYMFGSIDWKGREEFELNICLIYKKKMRNFKINLSFYPYMTSEHNNNIWLAVAI
jgi:hypothetical protein